MVPGMTSADSVRCAGVLHAAGSRPVQMAGFAAADAAIAVRFRQATRAALRSDGGSGPGAALSEALSADVIRVARESLVRARSLWAADSQLVAAAEATLARVEAEVAGLDRVARGSLAQAERHATLSALLADLLVLRAGRRVAGAAV